MQHPKVSIKHHSNNIITWVIKNTWLIRGFGVGFDFGYGNGYIALPTTHPLFGTHYDDERLPHIHGGWTYSQEEEYKGHTYWVFGFDTCHGWDSLQKWPRRKVAKEIQSVVKFFESFTNK